jgi:hypothetical protein
MDETSKQLLRDAQQPLPMQPGQPERQDYEYERGGVVNLRGQSLEYRSRATTS